MSLSLKTIAEVCFGRPITKEVFESFANTVPETGKHFLHTQFLQGTADLPNSNRHTGGPSVTPQNVTLTRNVTTFDAKCNINPKCNNF